MSLLVDISKIFYDFENLLENYNYVHFHCSKYFQFVGNKTKGRISKRR